MHPKPNFPSTPPIKICSCGLEIDKPGASNTRTRILVVVGKGYTIACFDRINVILIVIEVCVKTF